MGENQNSVVVLWIWLKFWCMIPMGVKYNHTKFERETRRWRRDRQRDSQVADLRFKIRQKWPDNAFFWAVWVPRICVKGSICIGTNLNDKQTPFIIV